jgi:hypothetical protein
VIAGLLKKVFIKRKKMRRASSVILFLFLIGGSGCVQKAVSVKNQTAEAAPWNYERISGYMSNVPGIRKMERWNGSVGEGIRIETEHYQIFTTLTDPLMLRQAPSFVESAYRAYQGQVPDLTNGTEKFKVYLFGDRKDWEQYTRETTGPMASTYLKIQRGAYALDGVCVAYNIGRKQTFSVLGHEGWHQFNQRYFKYRLPSWLDEGVATLFETCQYRQGQFEFRPQDNLMRLGTLRQVLQQNRMIPLSELIALNPGQVLDGYGSDGDAVMAFYAQNYAMVRFLREYDYGRRLESYHNLLLGGLRGNWPIESYLAQMAGDRNVPLTVAWNSRVSPQLFEMYIGKDVAAMEEQYLRYCGDIVYRIRLKGEMQKK